MDRTGGTSDRMHLSPAVQRGAILAGTLLFVLSLLLYQSFSSRVVLDRWSVEFLGVILAADAGWLFLLYRLTRSTSRTSGVSTRPVALLSVAILAWGAAYLITSLDSPAAAGRILELNLIGSDHPLAVLLELLALWLATIAAILLLATRVPSKLQNAGLTLATVAILALIGESYVRINAIARPTTQNFPTHTAQLWNRRFVDLNSMGFRDIEHEIHAGDRRRVLFVGDSFTFGAGVNDVADRASELTADVLPSVAGGKWESINAGLRNTHTLRHIDFLNETLRFQPEVVVLLYVFNDIDYLVQVTPTAQLISDRGPLGRFNPFRVLYLNSYLAQELYVRIRNALFFLGPQVSEVSPYLNDETLSAHMKDISRFVQIGRDAGAHVLIVPYDIYLDSDDRVDRRYDHFLATAESHQLPVCDMRGVFEGTPPQQLRVNWLDNHPNGLANRLTAARTADCIRDQLSAIEPN